MHDTLRRRLALLVLVSACSSRSAAGLDATVAGSADAADPDAADRDAASLDARALDAAGPDASRVDAAPPCVPPAPGTAPTYTELYTRYFAAGTAGHCATDGCHDGPNYNAWLCGQTKDDCYRGMLREGLIDPTNPAGSRIADPLLSPLVWVNPLGPMPRDGTQPFPPGSDATTARNEIIAWANACAQDD